MQLPGLDGLPRGLIFAAACMLTVGAQAADPTAGRNAAAACAECHEPKDWEGESQAALESLIRDVVQGAVKHSRKISLSDAEIANIAAYWAAASR